MNSLSALNIKIHAAVADQASLLELYRHPLVQGITTDPTSMRMAGISAYENFAKEVLETVRSKPISFQVFAEDVAEMRRQALKIRDWQENVYVKVPALSPAGENMAELLRDLAKEGVKLDVTAVFSERQIEQVAAVLEPSVPSIISIFASRVADTGRDPLPLLRASHDILSGQPKIEILWDGAREVFQIFQAEEARIHIVSVSGETLEKAVALAGRDLDVLSLETVQAHVRDANEAGFSLATGTQALAEAVAAALQKVV